MDIVSASLKQIKSNLISASIYFNQLLFLFLFLLISFAVTERITDGKSFVLVVLVLFGFIQFTYSIGKKRRKEITRITEMICRIRKNEIKEVEEIKLNANLIDLETEIRKMVNKTGADMENLQKLANTRRDFLANVSHELRTPIFAIQGFLETVIDGKVEDPVKRHSFLEKALKRTEGLNVLLNDLINISLIESGAMKLEFESFNLNELVTEVVKEYETSAEKKGLYILTDFEKQDIRVSADRKRIKQALQNLLQNSVRYTETGGINIFSKIKDDLIYISVRDTGVGIPAEDIDRVFERFYRVDKARSRKIGGTGLGLAITKHIIEAHGSKIQVKSKLDKGSEFSFSLKLK